MILLLFASLSLADVVDDPPTDCPPGSVGTTGHSGAYCRPEECGEDPDGCEEGTTCMALDQCITTNTYTVDSANPREVTELRVEGLCAEDGSCAVGTCETLSVCASEGEVRRTKCGCASGGEAGGLAALAAGLLLSTLRRKRPFLY